MSNAGDRQKPRRSYRDISHGLKAIISSLMEVHSRYVHLRCVVGAL